MMTLMYFCGLRIGEFVKSGGSLEQTLCVANVSKRQIGDNIESLKLILTLYKFSHGKWVDITIYRKQPQSICPV